MNQFQELFEKQKNYFNTGQTKTYEWRITQLERIQQMLMENQDVFYEAVGSDFKTASSEYVLEVNAPVGNAEFSKAYLKSWMEPLTAPLPKFLVESGHKAEVYREPYGVSLVIGAFNVPLISLLNPAIGAISAGNTVVLKTHEATAATSALLEKLVARYFEPEVMTVVSGDKTAVIALLKLPFDFIFFTGSPRVGKIVMRAAAEHLTPVILELGGQNPAIVDETANIADAAKKIVWGATAWAGQWCTSPGYAYVHESVAAQFVEEAKKAIVEFYGEDPKNNPDLSRIISSKEVNRISSLLDPAKVVHGGAADPEARYFQPTLVYPVTWSDQIMEEEIFGPVLPIMVYKDLNEVITNVTSRPKPLSAYIFSREQSTIDTVINTLSFGGGAVNQVNVQVFIVTLPYGGVGNSGMGNYYGKYGFDAMTNAKGVLISPADVSIDHLFPPYTMEKVQALNNWSEY